MTIIEQAISHYKYGISHDIFSEPVTTYAQLSIDALEKQIPMQHHHTKVLEVHDNARISVCPNCLSCIVTKAEEFPRFCNWCGQALDWSK